MSLSDISPEILKSVMEGPALMPPQGVISNFVDPYSFYRIMLIVNVTLYVLTTLVVGLRVFSKFRVYRKLALNDYILLLGWSLSISILILTTRGPENVMGVHQYNVQVKKLSDFIYLVNIGTIVYAAANVLIKSSILLQYIAIFSPAARDYFYWSCHFIIVLNIVTYTIIDFIQIFTCKPIAKKWNFFLEGTCMNHQVVNIVTGVINVISDLTIVALPQKKIWNLHMNNRRRLGVSLIFAVGLLACAAAITRLYYSIMLFFNDDVTWYTSLMTIFALVELSFGTITSCLPSLPKAFRALGDTVFISRISSFFSKNERSDPANEFRSSSWNHPFMRHRKNDLRRGTDGFASEVEMDLVVPEAHVNVDREVVQRGR